MLVIEVQTPAFSGRFLHTSEISPSLVLNARSNAMSLTEEITEVLKLCLLDQSQIDNIDELRVSQAQEVWRVYCATQPTRLEIPDAMPAWL